MKLMEELAEVMSCNAESCAYNNGMQCHAYAITVRDGCTPRCDTMIAKEKHCQRMGPAGVGACKISMCEHNDDMECHSNKILMEHVDGSLMCATFNEV
ncbi:MAG: DUF1540 domain-containing protein [Planctomycetota bacterium]|jgi:hypothetical protein